MMQRICRVSFIVTVCFSLLVTAAMAQFKAGVQGTIEDPTGAVVAGAKVSVTSQDTGRMVSVTSSGVGFYRVSGLGPGLYTVTVEAAGFGKSVTTDVRVGAEETRGFDVKLQVGTAQQTATVTAGAGEMKTEDANMGRVISNDEVLRLPQVGRDPYELLRLAPGVFGDSARSGAGLAIGLPNNAGPGGSNTSVFQVENQVQISAAGQRVSANNYEVDGVNVNSLTWGGAAVVTPNQESVEEVKVIAGTYSAEDGRNSGAQIKVISKGGTNRFHGSAIFKYNEPGLNAFNKFPTAPDRVNNKFRQYGGSIGGPILKDKLFFFFSFEGVRDNSSGTENKFVETSEYRELIKNIRPGGITAAVLGDPGIAPRIVNVLPVDCTNFINQGRPCQVVTGGLDIGSPTGGLNQYVSLGNPGGGGLDGIPDVQFAQIALPNKTRGQQYNSRVDYNRGSDQFTFSTFFTKRNDRGSNGGAQGRPMADLNFKPLNSAIMVSWVRTINSRMLNEARANFSRFAFDQVADSGNVNFGIPRIEVEGLPIGDRIRFGADRSEGTPGIFAQNTYEFRDNFTWQFASHVVKFGADIRREQDNNNLLGGARPLFSFVGLFNLANDTPIFEAINADPRTGAPADARRHFRTNDYGFFIQDDWKVRPNLTLNLGLRYEYFTPLREKDGLLTNLILGTGPNALFDAKLKVSDELYNPDRNNFAPRLGFAWIPGMFNDKIVWRGGIGVNYNRIPNALFTNTRGNPPFFARFNLCCGTASTDFGTPFANGQILYALGADTTVNSFPANPVLAQGIDPATGLPINGQVEIWGAPQNTRTAYVYNYSLETQMSLPLRLTATLGYQGSSSHKLIRIVNQNFIFDVTNPKFFQVFFPTPDVNANYHSMNLNLSRRFANGFQLDAKYRWSKSIDTLSNEGPGAQTNQTFPRDLRLERGPSDFDAGQSIVISGYWDLPIFRNRKDALGIALGGWQLSGVLTAHSGFPWTPKTNRVALQFPGGASLSPVRPIAFFGGAGSSASTDTFLSGNGNFPGGGLAFFDISAAGTPGIGRNSFRGPRYSVVDFTFGKETALPFLHLGEQSKLDLRVNMFNAFNKLNLAPFGFFSAGTIIEDSRFGQAENGLAGRVVELQARFSF